MFRNSRWPGLLLTYSTFPQCSSPLVDLSSRPLTIWEILSTLIGQLSLIITDETLPRPLVTKRKCGPASMMPLLSTKLPAPNSRFRLTLLRAMAQIGVWVPTCVRCLCSPLVLFVMLAPASRTWLVQLIRDRVTANRPTRLLVRIVLISVTMLLSRQCRYKTLREKKARTTGLGLVTLAYLTIR